MFLYLFPLQKDSPAKPSVAELAGRFKGHILPMPTSNDQVKVLSFKDTLCNFSIYILFKCESLEKSLKISLSLPDVKLQPPPSPLSPLTPLSPSLRPPQPSSEEEEPVGFETPPEGTTLPNFNKTRARLSFKRRPPTRQHRKSAGEEPTSPESSASPCELSHPTENGLGDQVFPSPTEEATSGPGEQEKEGDRDCDTIAEEEVTRGHPEEKSESEEQTGEEQGKTAEGQEEEEQEQKPPSEHCADEGEGSEEKMETRSEEADKDGNEGI
uniref:FAM21/CAPZIP domain-containing protein n=1 Tax=Periophthalmus magnuspinnatus TaxID=409849 RepID=A0A3B4A3T3_9GOBI